MKKLVVLSLFTAFALGVYATGETTKLEDENRISYVTKKQFESEFKDAKNVVWSVSSVTQKASFVLNDRKMSAFYDLSGKYLGTIQYANFNDMPYKALREVSESYKGFSPVAVLQIADRPANAETNDTGAYIVAMTNGGKEVYLQVSYDGYVSLYKKRLTL
jgi:hypothetical protein